MSAAAMKPLAPVYEDDLRSTLAAPGLAAFDVGHDSATTAALTAGLADTSFGCAFATPPAKNKAAAAVVMNKRRNLGNLNFHWVHLYYAAGRLTPSRSFSCRRASR